MIRLTMVAARQQISALARDREGRPPDVNLSDLTEADLVAKECYLHRDDIRAVTHPNDPMPIIKSVIVSASLGQVFCSETPEEVDKRVRRYGE